ncbi:hypothetical protein DID80_06650 [Candidatus Marinamargulisbacteria bacterium SCGC AAA071-K20]|nr:hypothetical protein DID80_06650 [Candidatus Marinamargulisbacteria bacterium SCGC AAA071-K20]
MVTRFQSYSYSRMVLNHLKKQFIPLLLIFTVLFIGACSTRSTDDPEVSLTDDGFKSVELINMTIEWRVTQDTKLEVVATAPTSGWIGIGFSPTGARMSGANIIMGYIDDSGNLQIEDRYGSSSTNHSKDSQDDLTNTSGSETSGSTTIKFTIPLNSGDSNDRPLTEGAAFTIMAAYGDSGEDNYTAQHNSSKRIRQSIGAL